DLLRQGDAKDFGREVIPSSLGRYRVSAYLFRGYWADVVTVDSFYDANILLTRSTADFRFYDPHRPIYTHPRFLPGSRFSDCSVPTSSRPTMRRRPEASVRGWGSAATSCSIA